MAVFIIVPLKNKTHQPDLPPLFAASSVFLLALPTILWYTLSVTSTCRGDNLPPRAGDEGIAEQRILPQAPFPWKELRPQAVRMGIRGAADRTARFQP